MKKLNYRTILLLSLFVFSMTTATFFIGVAVATDVKTSQPKSSDVALTIIVTDQQVPGVQAVVSDFLNSKMGSGVSGVSVESSGTTADQQLTLLSTAMASSSTDYDVIGIDVVWTAQFASNGWIIPLDTAVTPAVTASEMNDFVAGMVDACTYNGHYYAYPYFMNLGILWYRKDLMDLNGFTPADFETWEGLNDTANYILNNVSGTLTNPNLVGYVSQFDNYEGGVVNFFEIAASNGATNLISGTNVNIYPNAKAQAAMEFFQKLFPPQYTGVQGTPYIIPRSGLVMDEGSSIGVWTLNNSIFMRQWTFAYQSSLDAGIDFGIAPLPHFQGASGYKTSCVGGAILAIPTFISSTKRAAAINLTRYLGMETAQEAELTTVSNFPALKSVYDNPPTGYEWIGNWTDQLGETLSRPVEAQYPSMSNTIANEFSNILAGGKTAAAGLQAMQTTIEQIFAGVPEVGIPGYSVGLILLAAVSVIGIMIILRKRRM
jgi:multiple sugar transport system substrate-binding protein